MPYKWQVVFEPSNKKEENNFKLCANNLPIFLLFIIIVFVNKIYTNSLKSLTSEFKYIYQFKTFLCNCQNIFCCIFENLVIFLKMLNIIHAVIPKLRFYNYYQYAQI